MLIVKRGNAVHGGLPFFRVFGFKGKYLKKLQLDWGETVIFGKFTLKSI